MLNVIIPGSYELSPSSSSSSSSYYYYYYAEVTISHQHPAMAGLLFIVYYYYYYFAEVTISPLHPAWIGAWWLGFVIFGVLSIVLAFPLLFFPRRMKPKSAMEKKTTLSKSSDKMGVKGNIFIF